MKKQIAYLCVPYSHPDPEVRSSRAVLADKAAALLIEQGYVVFSPISHSHRIAHHLENHNDSDFWIEQDVPFLEIADVVVVLKINGWGKSRGVERETIFAAAKGKKIIFMEW